MANARSEATKRWREKTGLKLVQAYLHTDTIDKLDELVRSAGASGRGAVLADLIDKATAQEQPQPPAMPQQAQQPQAMPEPQRAQPLDLRANDHRCQARTGTGERCKAMKNLKLIEFHINDKPISAWACYRHVDRFKPCTSARQAASR